MDPYPEDCDGCDATYAFVFKGTSAGTDTVKLIKIVASGPCSDTISNPEAYIIQVKN